MIDEKVLIERLEEKAKRDEQKAMKTDETEKISLITALQAMADRYTDAIKIVNQLAEGSNSVYFQNGILSELQKFLKEKVKYNSEQAEIWRNGSDKDAYFREKKDLYMDRANIYGGVMRVIERLAEESKNGWIPCEKELPPMPKENPLFENKPLELYLVSIGSGYPWRAFWNGKYFTDGWSTVDAIAWQPLPAPYQPGE